MFLAQFPLEGINIILLTYFYQNWKVKGNEVTLEEEEVLLTHLQTPPKFTIVRINNMACDGTQLKEVISNALQAVGIHFLECYSVCIFS